MGPDFAYPKSVGKAALKAYDEALKSGNELGALEAAVKLSIAENLVSNDSVEPGIERFSYLGSHLKAPYNAVAMLLEAETYASAYNLNPYAYNMRKLPAGAYPSRMQEWDKGLFATRVDSLVNAALKVEGIGEESIEKLGGLLDKKDSSVSRAVKSGMTVADFIDWKGAEILGNFGNSSTPPLRFGSIGTITPSDQCGIDRRRLIDDGYDRNLKAGKLEIASLFGQRKYEMMGAGEQRDAFLKDAYGIFSKTNFGSWAVAAYARQMQKDKDLSGALAALKDYLKAFPAAQERGQINEMISQLEAKAVNLEHENQVMANQPWDCRLTVNNLKDFKILIYRLDNDWYGDGSIQISKAMASGKRAASVDVTLDGDSVRNGFISATVEKKMPALEPGLYIAFPTVDGSLKGIVANSAKPYAEVFRVSSLSFFVSDTPDGDKKLYVVDGATMQPIAGAKVVRQERVYRGTPKTDHYTTGADGGVVVPNGNAELRISYGKDCVAGNYYGYSKGRQPEKKRYSATVLTDLGIYKPGQEMRFAGVVFGIEDHKAAATPNANIRALLRDVNYRSVGSLDLTTDNHGRVEGKFTIPDNGLLGGYQIQLFKDDDQIGMQYFQVAEYKSPTFLVKMTGAAGEYKPGDTVTLKGEAATYSGMPVAGAKVDFKIKYQPLFWRWGWNGESQECGGSTTSGPDGKFAIILPTSTLVGTPYEKGLFTVSVTVTDLAGETQEAPAELFSLGQAYGIDASIPSAIESGAHVAKANVKVTDVTGNPVDRPVYYRISDKKKIEAEGEYEGSKFMNTLEALPSGKYDILFSLSPDMKGELAENAQCTTIVWRSDDRRPAVDTPLWLPVTNIVVPKGEKKVEIPVGSSYADSYLFMQVADSRGVREERWVKVSDENIKVSLDAPADNERLFVKFYGMHDLSQKSGMVTLIPEAQTEKVEIMAESFRDKVTPGDREKWKFSFTYDGKPMSAAPVMAVMSNKALNALAPFEWSLNPYAFLYWNNSTQLSYPNYYKATDSYSKIRRTSANGSEALKMPQFQFYGYGLVGKAWYEEPMFFYSTGSPVMARGTKSMRAVNEMKVMEPEVEEASAEDSDGAVMEKSAVTESGAEEGSREELRPVECPLAFFMPDLTTDANGTATLDFTVPQFNGTWQLQVAGYNPDMKGAVKTLDVVASKKVMVQLNAPRFLRTGDKATISATLFNNSGEAIAVGGRIEIYDAVGNALLASRDFDAEELKNNGSKVVTIDYSVPGNISSILVRAYAYGNSHRDGEQTLVAVLPSSTPVLESKPFYAGPGRQTIDASMPKNAGDGSVTLQYCGNPIWECITALPEIIIPKSDNILAKVDALYGMAIASGLIKRYPGLRKGIRTFADPENAGDSTLVSSLQKNQNLKLASLGNTPWVNSANDETRRMQSLVKYLFPDDADKSVKDLVDEISRRQNNDGGWSWCDGMPSSEFITGRVLLHYAMLKGMGYLPEMDKEAIPKAFRYADAELVKDWKRSNPRNFSTHGMLNYLYVKSFFQNLSESSDFKALRAAALKKIEKEWKNFDIYDKATAVTLEWRLGKAKLAGEILESMRQYASVSPEKGMWFDNLHGVYTYWNPLITTAQVLEAYGEVAPKDAAVDQLRQWLLMSKQTQNWGELRGTAEVVQAILSTGADWTADSEPAVVTVGGKEIGIPSRSKIVDSFTVTLSPKEVKKGKVKIEKYSAGPAWGGIVSQYVEPILDVKAAGIPQLAIRKEVFAIGADGKVTGSADGLKVGDRVRVTLTIVCDRDMQYVMVNDGRSACLEPAEQVSGYTSSDGMWYYQETRNDATNLFIPFVGKGTHVVNYECFVDRAGTYTAGVATAQSQYAPVITAHSAGLLLKVGQ